jgi:hypothetical protein
VKDDRRVHAVNLALCSSCARRQGAKASDTRFNHDERKRGQAARAHSLRI